MRYYRKVLYVLAEEVLTLRVEGKELQHAGEVKVEVKEVEGKAVVVSVDSQHHI